jgi:hypothetical protein
MKKIMALFIISFFLISIVPATVSANAKDLDKSVLQKWNNAMEQARMSKKTIDKYRRYLANEVFPGIRNADKIEDPAKLKQGLIDFLTATTTELKSIRDNDLKYSCVDEKKENTVNYINKVIEDGEALLAQVEATDSQETDVEYYRDVIKKIKNYHNNGLGPAFKYYIGKTHGCKIKAMFNNLENLITRLTDMTDAAEAKGLDVIEARQVIVEMRTKLDLTYDSYDELKAFWIEDVNTYQEANQAYESAKNFFINKLVPNSKDIYKDARTVYKNLRSHGQSLRTIKADGIKASAQKAGAMNDVEAQRKGKSKNNGKPFDTVAGNKFIVDTDASIDQTADEEGNI